VLIRLFRAEAQLQVVGPLRINTPNALLDLRARLQTLPQPVYPHPQRRV